MANQKRNDTRIGNIEDLPNKVKKNYRKDTHLGTVLDDYHVTSKNLLKKKLRDQK